MRFRVGYQIQPQHCTVQQIREAYRAADSLRVDTLWVWDHMFPLSGPADGNHFACLPILAAIATETRHAQFGSLVHANSYRNGAPRLRRGDDGPLEWRARDPRHRRRLVRARLPGVRVRVRDRRVAAEISARPSRIKARLGKLVPPPIGSVPIMIGARREGHAEAHRPARRPVEHVPAQRRQLAAQETRS